MSTETEPMEHQDPETPGWLTALGLALLIIVGGLVFVAAQPTGRDVAAKQGNLSHAVVHDVNEPRGPAAVALRQQRAKASSVNARASKKKNNKMRRQKGMMLRRHGGGRLPHLKLRDLRRIK